MAVTVSTTKRLALLAGFVDEDDRTISVPNPRSDVTAADIVNLNARAQNVLIGDKFGAQFSAFKKATKYTTTRTKHFPES